MEKKEKQDHIDRFKEVADGLKLEPLIANKLANFIHFEVMSAYFRGKKDFKSSPLT